MNDDIFKKRKKNKFVSILADIYLELKLLVHNSTIASAFLPAFFVITGIGIILFQFRLEIIQFINSSYGYTNQGNISPVSNNFLAIENYIAVPTGLTEMTQEALNKNLLVIDPETLKFSEVFYISIPELGINRLPIKPNVESTTESVYKEVLEYTLAHFKNTSLPISELKNNMVVYGHSASLSYGPARNDPRVAFSFLPEVKLGNEIIIEIGGQTYTYQVSRTKVVNPTDTSVITGTAGQQTLTLFTCYPIGNNTQRFVVIAREK